MSHTETWGAGDATVHRGLGLSDAPDDSAAVVVEPTITDSQDISSTRGADTRKVRVTSWDRFDEMLAHLQAGDRSRARRALIGALNQQ